MSEPKDGRVLLEGEDVRTLGPFCFLKVSSFQAPCH